MTDLLQAEKATGVCWFVGAMYGGRDDQMPRFIEEGIWENGYEDKHLDSVKSIKVGDRIAIKAGMAHSRWKMDQMADRKENYGDRCNPSVNAN